MGTFESDLENVINRHSKENGSNTPDFILAELIVKVLDAYDHTVTRRDEWGNDGLEEMAEDKKSAIDFIQSLPDGMPVFILTSQSKLEIRTATTYADQLSHPASKHGAQAQAKKMEKWAEENLGSDDTIPEQRVGGKSLRDKPQFPPESYWSEDKQRYITKGEPVWNRDEYLDTLPDPHKGHVYAEEKQRILDWVDSYMKNGKIRLYREIIVPPDGLQTDQLGIFWTPEKSKAHSPFGRTDRAKGKPVVVEIVAPRSGVDEKATVSTMRRYPGEREVRLKSNTRVKVIRPKRSKGNTGRGGHR